MNPVTSDDGTLPADCSLVKWNALLLEASLKLGARLDCASEHKERMIEAGFKNVVQVDFKWPINGWPKDPKYKNLGKLPDSPTPLCHFVRGYLPVTRCTFVSANALNLVLSTQGCG